MSSKTKNWTVERIREELKKIDDMIYEKHGIALEGANLDIMLTNKQSRYGAYYLKEVKFEFSLYYFNSDVPESCVIDVIRHEYAHYYAHTVMGYTGGHGKEFKAACQVVGANPSRFAEKWFEENRRREEKELNKRYKSRFYLCQAVKHPVYGDGVIIGIKEERNTAILEIDFLKAGVKKVDERWILKKK